MASIQTNSKMMLSLYPSEGRNPSSQECASRVRADGEAKCHSQSDAADRVVRRDGSGAKGKLARQDLRRFDEVE